jgi:Mg-chelatase subunit ChlD
MGEGVYLRLRRTLAVNKPLRITIGVILLFLMSVSIITWMLVSETIPTYRVVIIPLENRTPHSEIDYLATAFPLTLAANLTESQQIEVITSGAVHQIYDNLRHQDIIDPYHYLGEYYDATVVIGGLYSRSGDQFTVELKCYFTQQESYDLIQETGNYHTDFHTIQRNVINRVITNMEWGLDLTPFRTQCGKYYRSLLILLDSSGSMKDDQKIETARTACNEILDKVNPENTEVALLRFSGDECQGTVTNLVHPFSNNIRSLKQALEGIPTRHGTPLSKAIREAIQYMESHHKGRMGHIVVIGDGQDDCENMTEAKDAINQSILHISLDTVGLNIPENSSEEEDLKQIAEGLGGSYYSVSNHQPQSQGIQQLLTDPDLQPTPTIELENCVVDLGY